MSDLNSIQGFNWIRCLKYTGGIILSNQIPAAGLLLMALSPTTGIIILLLGFIGMFALWAWIIIGYLKPYAPRQLLPVGALLACVAAIELVLALLVASQTHGSAATIFFSNLAAFVLTLAITWTVRLWRTTTAGNEISATSAPVASAAIAPASDHLDQLIKLKQLHDNGAISDEQFSGERARIMQPQRQ